MNEGIKIYYLRDYSKSPLTTVAIARNCEREGLINRAVAMCSNLDYPPKKSIGRNIAVGRLRKLLNGKPSVTSPEHYLQTGLGVLPTEYERKLLRIE